MISFLNALQLNPHDLDVWAGSLSLPCWDLWAWHLCKQTHFFLWVRVYSLEQRKITSEQKSPWGGSLYGLLATFYSIFKCLLVWNSTVYLSHKAFIDLQCTRPWTEGCIQGRIYLLSAQRNAAKDKAIRSHLWGVMQCARTFCERWMATDI